MNMYFSDHIWHNFDKFDNVAAVPLLLVTTAINKTINSFPVQRYRQMFEHRAEENLFKMCQTPKHLSDSNLSNNAI